MTEPLGQPRPRRGGASTLCVRPGDAAGVPGCAWRQGDANGCAAHPGAPAERGLARAAAFLLRALLALHREAAPDRRPHPGRPGGVEPGAAPECERSRQEEAEADPRVPAAPRRSRHQAHCPGGCAAAHALPDAGKRPVGSVLRSVAGYIWKLLRRDQKLSLEAAKAVVRRLVAPVTSPGFSEGE